MADPAVHLHLHPSVRLGVVGGADLPHLALQPEQRAGHRQRRAPLTGTGLGGQLGDALGGVVVRLGHRGVRLVRPGRADALVLVEDLGRRGQRLLQPVRPDQRRRPPERGRSPVPARGSRSTARSLTSCMISASGNSGARSCGPSGSRVPGCRAGGRGFGQVGGQVVPVGRDLRRDHHGIGLGRAHEGYSLLAKAASKAASGTVMAFSSTDERRGPREHRADGPCRRPPTRWRWARRSR